MLTLPLGAALPQGKTSRPVDMIAVSKTCSCPDSNDRTQSTVDLLMERLKERAAERNATAVVDVQIQVTNWFSEGGGSYAQIIITGTAVQLTDSK